VLKLGKDLFDGIEVGTIGRQEQELGAYASDSFADFRAFVTAEVVHDDNIARFQCRQKELFDIETEGLTVDRAVDDAGRVDAVTSQSGQERHGVPVPERGVAVQTLATWTPSPQRSHVCFRPGLINEDKAFRIEPALIFSPLLPAPGDVRAILFAGHKAFF